MRLLIPSGNKGLTAFELIVAVALLAILTGVAMPSFLGAMQRYRLDGAARTIVSQIRYARSLAVSNDATYGFHWGGDPNLPPGYSNGQYRTERSGDGTCAGWPDPALTPADANVVSGWMDLSDELTGVTITSIQDSSNPVKTVGGAMFNSRGASVNNCIVGVTYPVRVTISDTSGATRIIEIRPVGTVRIL